MAEPFDLDGPVLAESRAFTVIPARGGGWGPLCGALARLLTRATQEGLWWATICLPDDAANRAFAHLGPDEGGALYTEVAGDYYLPVSARLTEDQWGTLRRLGWADPVPELAEEAEAVARVKGTSLNALIVDSLSAEIERVRGDEDFTARARKLLERDRELLDRLAQ
jgi:hypothetical protein